MSKISTYDVAPVPKLADKLIGTSVGGTPDDGTYNFTLQELLTLFLPNIPANNLQGVLDYGNTAIQDINLTGTIYTTDLDVSSTATILDSFLTGDTHITGGLFDVNTSIGTAGQVLTSTGFNVEWYTIPTVIPDLQQVLTAGNTANVDILLNADIQALDVSSDTATFSTDLIIDGTLTDGTASVGTAGKVLSSTGTGVQWVSLPVYSATSPLFFNSGTGVFSIQVANGTQDGYLTSADWITFNGKQNAGNYITALTGEATATGPGSVAITLSNTAVIGKILTGLSITGAAITSTDTILQAFGKAQNQINGKQDTITLTTTGTSGAATLIGATLNIPNYADTYVGTVTSVSFTLGSSGTDLSSSVTNSTTTPSITLNVPTASASARGALSAADWTTFNSKQIAGNYITSLTGEATASGPGAAAITLTNSAVIAKVLTGLNVTGGTVIAADTILAAFGKVQNQINGLIGGSVFQGVWNASTNTPALVSSVGTNGHYYIVSVAGSTNLDGITDWQVGDWAIFAGTSWQKVDNTDAVSSVNGFTGAVSLTTDNVPEGATNLYFTNTRARTAISLTTTGSSGASTYDNTTGVFNIPTYTDAYVGTVTSVGLSSATSGVTIGSTPVTTSGTITIAIATATTLQNGLLSSTDWTTFNNKQGTITLTTTGTSGAATFISNTLNIPDYGAVLTGYVPYTGANQTLAMGTNNGITLTDTSSNTSISITSSSTGQGAILVTKSGNGEGIRVLNGGIGSGFLSANTSTGIGFYINNSSTGIGLKINNDTSATGDPFIYTLNNVSKAKIDYLGNITGVAGTFTGQLTLGSTITNGTYTYTLPSATGTLALTSDIHSAVTLSAIGSTPNANAATLTGQVLNLEPASASFGGVVTTGTQTFAGDKTFNGTVSGVNVVLGSLSGASALQINRVSGNGILINDVGGGGNASVGINNSVGNSTGFLYQVSGSSQSGTGFEVNATSTYSGIPFIYYKNSAELFKVDTTGKVFGSGANFTGQLTLGSTITNGTYTYTLPSATGTLALTSALSGYLPLTGGTLTGALSGTSATFTGTLIQQNITDGTNLIGLNTSNSVRQFNLFSTTTYSAFGTATNNPILILTNDTERMRITSDGNVGIGITSPGAKLVVSNGGANGFEIDPLSASGTQTSIFSYNRSTSAWTPYVFSGMSYKFQVNGTTDALTIASTGAATFTGALSGTSATFTSTGNAVTITTSSSASNVQLKVNNGANGDIYAGVAASDGSSVFTGTTAYSGYIGTNVAVPFYIATGGAARVTIASTGAATFSSSVTLQSAGKLTVNRSDNARYGEFYTDNIAVHLTSSTDPLRISSADRIEFYNAGSERMRITSGGLVGIGVTPNAWFTSGGYKVLQIGAGLSLDSGNDFRARLAANAYVNTSGDWAYANTGFASTYTQDSGQHVWKTAPTGAAGNAITFTERMCITSGGNVLIGTTTDNGSKLQVTGAATFSSSVTASSLIKSGGTAAQYLMADGSTRTTSSNAYTLKDWYASGNNVSSTETDLMTYTVPANTLVNNGDKLSFTFGGIFGSVANSKTLRVYFGTTAVVLNSITEVNVGWQITGTIIKDSATTYRFTIVQTNINYYPYTMSGTSGTVTNYTGTNVFKITGQGTSSSDLTAQMGTLQFIPAG